MKTGDRVLIKPGHPHAGEVATLVSFGTYGPSFLSLHGWLCRAESGMQFYASTQDFKRVK